MCLFGGGGEDSAPKPAPPAETLNQPAPVKKTPSKPTIFDKKSPSNPTTVDKTSPSDTSKKTPTNPLTIFKNKPTVTGQTKKKMPTNPLAIGSKKYQNDMGIPVNSDVFPNGLAIN